MPTLTAEERRAIFRRLAELKIAADDEVAVLDALTLQAMSGIDKREAEGDQAGS